MANCSALLMKDSNCNTDTVKLNLNGWQSYTTFAILLKLSSLLASLASGLKRY